MTNHSVNLYDIIVIGCGGIGSAALYWLAKRGGRANILGVEQFRLGHDNGGSQDVSRSIRVSYAEPYYIPLVRGAYKAWRVMEEESGEQVVFKTGGIDIGRKGTETESVIRRHAATMKENQEKCCILEGEELQQRFPQLRTNGLFVVHHDNAGILDAARANSIHAQLAEAHGATILENTKVSHIDKIGKDRIQVHTNRGVFTCRRVVLTSGAWANNILRSIGIPLPLTVTQEQVTFFRTPNVKDFSKKNCPMLGYHLPDHGLVYCLPIHGNMCTKVGVEGHSPVVTAETRTFVPDPKRLKLCIDALKTIAPGFLGPISHTKTCLYTMTPDRHLIIDSCAQVNFSEVLVCCGAGHGYKFASVLGRILSDLAIDGHTSYDISRFTLDRQALTDPNYKPDFDLSFRDDLPSGEKVHSKL